MKGFHKKGELQTDRPTYRHIDKVIHREAPRGIQNLLGGLSFLLT